MAGIGASDILPYTISFFVNGEWVAEPRAVLPIKKSRPGFSRHHLPYRSGR